MSQTPTPTRINKDSGGDLGVEGVDSFTHPLYVRPTQLRWAENATTCGRMIQTRPGYKTRLALDVSVAGDFQLWWIASGRPILHPQMMQEFQPSNGGMQLVFAISGTVWFCAVNDDGSLEDPQRIMELSFCPWADQLVGQSCVQTASIVSGVYANNLVPRNLFIIQDGVNRPGIWDGLSGYRTNPEKHIDVDADGNTYFTTGYNETRIGLWMAWSGNRLFVFNGKLGFASDLGDPTHFTEELVQNSLPVFVFPEEVTGACDRGTSGTSRSQVIVFTNKTVWTLWSGIQNRFPSTFGSGWQYATDFQAKIFDGVGCVAGKSVIVHRGLLYWLSEDGIVLFDSSSTVYSTQNMPPIDQEMAYSRRRMAQNPSLTCAGKRGSYIFWSVPVAPVLNGRCYNGQTQVIDRQTTVVRAVGLSGPFSYGTTGWQGVWTGIRPVEWATFKVGGIDRVYALSMDQDGVPRIWEAFQGNRADNGHRIPWLVETPTHAVQPTAFDYAQFRYFRLLLDQIMGNLEVVGSYRGLRGQYHQLLNTFITATPGSVFTPVKEYVPMIDTTKVMSFTVQSRDIPSPNVRGAPTDPQAAGVESTMVDSIDRAFSLLFNFTGRGALVAYRLAVDSWPQDTEGKIIPDESGFNILPEAAPPVHEDGTTPDYLMADRPPRDAFVLVAASLDESTLYQSPPT